MSHVLSKLLFTALVLCCLPWEGFGVDSGLPGVAPLGEGKA